MTKKRKPPPFAGDVTDTPPKKQRKQATSAQDGSFAPNPSTLNADEIPFSLECPVQKTSKKRKHLSGNDDVFGPEEDDGGYPGLKIDYTIRPGKAWRELKAFKNFSIQAEKFPVNSIVYINRHTPPPSPPAPDSSPAEILAFDQANHWVGKVLEIKASSPSEVWLRVFWLYWPDELPGGRRDYHGRQELVMSNHMEIVDAKAVVGAAEVGWWDEVDDEVEEERGVRERVWRQRFDVRLTGRKGLGDDRMLSELRRHCKCRGYYNPDRTMVKCPAGDCGAWNHVECVEEAVLERTYKRLVEDRDEEEGKTFHTSKLGQLKEELVTIELKEEDGQPELEGTPSGMIRSSPKGPKMKKNKQQQQQQQQPAPWQGLFKAEVRAGDNEGGKASVTVTDERAQDPEIWTEPIQCLLCATPIE